MPSSFDPTQSLLFLTNRVARQLSTAALDGIEVDGWQPQGTQMGILADLLNEDGIRQQDLAICAFKDKATIARSLKGLEDNGLVRRKIDPDDRRQKIINLTDRGRRIFSRMEPQLESVVSLITQDIPEEDLRCCKKVLWQLYNTLQEQLQPERTEQDPTTSSHHPNIPATISN